MSERNIVSRLRDVSGFIQKEHGRVEAAACLATEAADEIERLRSALSDAITLIEVASDYASESVDWAIEAHAFLEQHKK